MEAIVEPQTVMTVAGGIVSTLAAAIAWLYKVQYVDNKKALADCKDEHISTKLEMTQRIDQERKDCESDKQKYQNVIDHLQHRVDSLQDQFVVFRQDSAIHKGRKPDEKSPPYHA